MLDQKEYLKKLHYKRQNVYQKRNHYKYQKEYQKRTDYKYLKIAKKRNYSNWKNHFIKKYGENPPCEVCEKQLQWYRKNGIKNTVCFDHKSEKTFIKETPAAWFQGHSYIKENIEKVEKENFGILCWRCNHFLPTENRLQWLKQVTNYILK